MLHFPRLFCFSHHCRSFQWLPAHSTKVTSPAPTVASCLRLPSESMSSSTTPAGGQAQLTVKLANGEAVQVSGAPGITPLELRSAVDSSLFHNWLRNIQSESGLIKDSSMTLRNVFIQGVDMFGRGIGFLKFKADVFDEETGKKVPGIVLSRGQSVAVLILLECKGESYAVLTEQARVPVGRYILELPAGMLDDEECGIVGTAVKEVEEEIGITLNLEDMVNLTDLLEPSTGSRVFPSPGGSDEEISLLLYRGTAEPQTIAALQGKLTGLQDHGELIKVRVVPYDKLWRMTADSKVLCAIALYEMGKKDGLLPPVGSL